ncbi:hypothetical protein SFRURICE_008508 [Spodoptera frugiperda]|nr:hypothetical protein SFRURICE_008508 [Spodoptera frugiperda]
MSSMGRGLGIKYLPFTILIRLTSRPTPRIVHLVVLIRELCSLSERLYFPVLFYIILLQISKCYLVSISRNPSEYALEPVYLPDDISDELYDALIRQRTDLEPILRVQRKNKNKDIVLLENDDDDITRPLSDFDDGRSVEIVDPSLVRDFRAENNTESNTVVVAPRLLPFLRKKQPRFNDTRKWKKALSSNSEMAWDNTWHVSDCFFCHAEDDIFPLKDPPKISLCHTAFKSTDWTQNTMKRYFRSACYYSWEYRNKLHWRYKRYSWHKEHTQQITRGTTLHRLGSYGKGCMKKFSDVSEMFTMRACRGWSPMVGGLMEHEQIKEALPIGKETNYTCGIAHHAILTPFQRGVSLYGRFHACTCVGRYCNNSVVNGIYVPLLIIKFLLVYSEIIITRTQLRRQEIPYLKKKQKKKTKYPFYDKYLKNDTEKEMILLENDDDDITRPLSDFDDGRSTLSIDPLLIPEYALHQKYLNRSLGENNTELRLNDTRRIWPFRTDEQYAWDNAWKVASCYVCYVDNMKIPRLNTCHKAFNSDDYRYKSQIKYFKTACYYNWKYRLKRYWRYRRYWWKGKLYDGSYGMTVHRMGAWTKGCMKRYSDVGEIWTYRACRGYWPMWIGGLMESRQIRLDFSISIHENETCRIAHHATLLPFHRGISLYGRLRTCACLGRYCNNSVVNNIYMPQRNYASNTAKIVLRSKDIVPK